MPIVVFPRLLMQLVSLLILAGAVYLIWRWWDGVTVEDADGVLRHARGPLWQLLVGLAGLAWSFGGGRLIHT